MSETYQTALSYERPPTVAELKAWEEARDRLSRCYDMAKSAALLWNNLTTLSQFLDDQNVTLASFATDDVANLNDDFMGGWNELQKIKGWVRQVEDQEIGLRFKNGDFDIIDPSAAATDGVGFGFPFIPVIAGVVVLTGLIARLVYVEKGLTKIREDYNAILEHSDDALCADPDSEICQNWEATKADKKYEVQKSFSEHLKESLGGVAGKGIGIGALVVVGGLAAAAFLRR